MGSYNDASREVDWKIEIYLNGEASDPVVVTRADYLIRATTLHEASSETSGFFGNFTSDEVSFVLYNDGKFSPTNKTSPYYGKIKKGVKVKAYSRPSLTDSDPWDEVGEFYVTDWQSAITGTTASVTANDKLHGVISAKAPLLKVQRGVTYADFIGAVLRALGINATIDNALVDTLEMAYTGDSNHEFISDLMIAALSWLFVDTHGNVCAKSMVAAARGDIKATLTDGDQIISVDAEQSINTDFDGASVVANIPYESEEVTLVEAKATKCIVGNETHKPMYSAVTPIVRIVKGFIVGESDVHVSGVAASQDAVTITTTNDETEEKEVDIVVTGTTIKTTPVYTIDDGESLLEVDSNYVQSKARANEIYRVLRKIVESKMPYITVEIKGNPTLEVGDKIKIESVKYNLDFTGLIVSNETTYTGGMHGTLKLIDASIFGL